MLRLFIQLLTFFIIYSSTKNFEYKTITQAYTIGFMIGIYSLMVAEIIHVIISNTIRDYRKN